MDLTEAEGIKKKWQEYTEELYKKDLHDTDNHDGVITDLEADILGCEIKWALGSITMNKASGGDGIPVVVSNSATPWTVAHQAPLSLGFPRQEYQNRLLFPSPGNLSNPRIEFASPILAGGFFTTEPPGKPF